MWQRCDGAVEDAVPTIWSQLALLTGFYLVNRNPVLELQTKTRRIWKSPGENTSGLQLDNRIFFSDELFQIN
jgi:hypothetical protein